MPGNQRSGIQRLRNTRRLGGTQDLEIKLKRKLEIFSVHYNCINCIEIKIQKCTNIKPVSVSYGVNEGTEQISPKIQIYCSGSPNKEEIIDNWGINYRLSEGL